MTNSWIDLKNSDCIFVFGANPVENHPASTAWINRARENGAKLVVVDPRISRTAAKADIYAPIRSGTNILFLGAMVNYAIENNRYHHDYVAHYTNAAFLLDPNYKGPADLDGYFSGFNPQTSAYDRSTWKYQTDADGQPLKDMTLQDPACVFQHLKRHYARYTLDMVERVAGCPKDKFLAVADEFTKTSQPGKAGSILYAMGQTQHTVGSQNVRMMALLQLLLGNIGMPGGGVNALRGESNVQGSTDMAVLYHIIPSYMPTPSAITHPTLKDYFDVQVKAAGKSYWVNTPKFMVSLLKAWWGDAANEENDFHYDYLPKIEANHSFIWLFQAMHAGSIKGLWAMGMNPAVSGPNSRLVNEALRKLEWMVIQELLPTETVEFWKAPGVDPTKVPTEVFALPAADALEKAGSIVTSGRTIQWRPKVATPPGDAKEDIWIFDRIYKALKKEYAGSTDPKDQGLLNLHWDYGDPPSSERVAQEIGGYWTRDVVDDKGTVLGEKGQQLKSFAELRADGATACGSWIYAGYMTNADDGEGRVMPAAQRRGSKDPGGMGIYPFWGYTWPVGRHIIYNRASADLEGKPWSPEKALIWWDEAKKSWVGYDVPDFGKTKAPSDVDGDSPFIMRPDLKGGLFAALNEGPFPEHYEPVESPVRNLISSVQTNPVIKIWDTQRGSEIGDHIGTSEQFPIVATTYRLVEQWQAGAMSRFLPWLAEAQPDMFLEISKELAKEKGIKNGERVIVSSARGQIEMVALVTARIKPFQIDGKTVHLVGMPWHYGWAGVATGAIANVLTPNVGDGNTQIPEFKAFLVNVRKAV